MGERMKQYPVTLDDATLKMLDGIGGNRSKAVRDAVAIAAESLASSNALRACATCAHGTEYYIERLDYAFPIDSIVCSLVNLGNDDNPKYAIHDFEHVCRDYKKG